MKIYTHTCITVDNWIHVFSTCIFFIDVEPPKFAGEMKDVTVQEGDNATFECRISGKPLPEVKW